MKVIVFPNNKRNTRLDEKNFIALIFFKGYKILAGPLTSWKK
jgi:hypothetical protein